MRLPGTHKLVTECALEVGRHRLGVRAFVARRPEENEAAVYRWLLEHNLKLYAVAFAVDRLGDIYLTGKIPLEQLSRAEVDRVLGMVAATADDELQPHRRAGLRRQHPARVGLAALPGGVDRQPRGVPPPRPGP